MKLRKKLSDAFWNTMGSGAFASISFVLLICVTREYGVVKAGSFGVAVTTAQLLYRIGLFAVRQYQVTDLNHEFSFATYASVKLISTLLSFFAFGIYLIVDSDSMNEFWQFFFLFLFYQILSISDLYQNRLFQQDQLDKAGISKCLIIGGYLGSFLILSAFRLELNVILAISFFVGLGISIADCFRYVRTEKIFQWDDSAIPMMKMVFPTFISNFLLAFTNSLPKYAVYYLCSRMESGYINSIFILLNIVELIGSFIYYPFISDITRNITENPQKVRKIVFGISGMIVLLGFAMAIVLGFMGNYLLSAVFDRDFSEYVIEAIYTVSISGTFVALIGLLYWIPIIFREHMLLFKIFLVGTVTALLGCIGGAMKYGIKGAVIGHSFAVGVVTVLLLRFFGERTHTKNDEQLKNDIL